MDNKQMQSKISSNLDNICILTYLIAGVVMLCYADSIEKIMLSGIILIISATMVYIVYIKEIHLTFEAKL